MDTSGLLTTAAFVEKGGVGKSTTAAHVAVSAAQHHDLDVLLIDLAGLQNDLVTQFGLDLIINDGDGESDIDAPISAVFGENWDFIEENIPNVIERMTFPTEEGVDLIPADPGLSGADANLNQIERDKRFRKLDAFITDHVEERYDLAVIDLPGAESNIALNGLFAAENVTAPLRPGAFEQEQLDRLNANLEDIRANDEYPGVEPALAMVLPTMIDRRTNLAKAFLDDLENAYPDVVGPEIVDTENIKMGQDRGQTLFAFADDELYGTGERARDAYQDATGDLLTRLGGN